MIEPLSALSLLGLCSIAAVLFSEDVQIGATPIAIPTTAETLVAVGTALSLPGGSAKAAIRGVVTLTPGTGTTAVTLTVRRGPDLTGAIVGAQNPIAGTFVAGSSAVFEVQFIDALVNVGGAQYCLSVKQTGASGNGSAIAAMIDTKLLSG